MSTLADPRNRIKTVIDTYYTAADVKKDDDATNASTICCWDGAKYPIELVFGGTKNVDGVYAVGTPKSSAITDYDGSIIGYSEFVPVKIETINKTGITGDFLRWRMERELRYILETHPAGSYYSVETLTPQDQDFKSWKLYGVTCNVTYERDISPVHATGITLSYGHGFLDDFNNGVYGSTIFTATSDGAADGTTIVNTAHTQGDDYWNGRYVKMLTGTAAGEICLILDFANAGDTITLYGAGFNSQILTGDTYVISNWEEHLDGPTVAAPTTAENDFLDLQVTAMGGNNTAYWSYPSEATNHSLNLGLSTSVYTKAIWRYQVGASSMYAKIVAVFSDASTQTLQDSSNATATTYNSATLTAGKTLDHLRFYANSGMGHVYYDFFLACEGVFTIPNFRYGFTRHLPVKDEVVSVPGMTGNLIQGLGCDLWYADCSGDLSKGTWTVGSYDTAGEVLKYIAHKGGSEPWQWLSETSGVHLKVRLSDLQIADTADNRNRNQKISFRLTEKRNSSAACTQETYLSRLGL